MGQVSYALATILTNLFYAIIILYGKGDSLCVKHVTFHVLVSDGNATVVSQTPWDK